MGNTYEQKVMEGFERLPQELKDIAESDIMKKVIDEVMPTSIFSEDSRIALENATLHIMLGVVSPKDFVVEIRKIDGVEDNEDASGIAQEINLRIFRPIRDELKKLHNIDLVALIQESIPEDERMNFDEAPPNALHSEIALPPSLEENTPPQKPSALSDIPKIPRPRPLDAELSRSVGLPPPPPPPPQKRPLDAELSESLRRPMSAPQGEPFQKQNSSGQSPFQTQHSPFTPPAPKPTPSFESPRLEPTVAERDLPLTGQTSTYPQSLPGEINTLPKAWERPPAEGLREFMKPKPALSDVPVKPEFVPKPPTPKTHVNPFAEVREEPEENLRREDILRGIEDPSSIISQPKPLSKPLEKPPAQYSADPYREPLR